MLRLTIACGVIAALAGCSGEEGEASANAQVGALAATAASGGGNEAQLAAYRPYLERNWQAGAEITPDEVRKMVEAEGAAKAVETLTTSQDPEAALPWNTVTAGIANGKPEWLAVAPMLRPGTDGGVGEEYSMALADALTVNPAGSLRLIAGEEGGAEGYCIASDYETPPEQIRAYYSAAIAHVETVAEPDLQAVKAECLKHLRARAAQPPA